MEVEEAEPGLHLQAGCSTILFCMCACSFGGRPSGTRCSRAPMAEALLLLCMFGCARETPQNMVQRSSPQLYISRRAVEPDLDTSIGRARGAEPCSGPS